MVASSSRKSAYKPINGTYVKVFCHVEQAKRRLSSRGSACPRCVMLSLSKHLAEANPKHNQPVSTRFLDYARNDRVGIRGE